MSAPHPWQATPAAPFEVLGSGELPVLCHVPHSGRHSPPEVRDGILLDDDALAEQQRLLTDHRTDVLAGGAIEAGATAFVNRLSRLVIDPERFLDPDQEMMESVGMGAVYTATTHGEPLRDPTPSQRARLLDDHFTPYAEALADTVDRVVDRHGHVTILDVHWFPSSRLPYEMGGQDRPSLCLGTDERHTPAWLRDLARQQADAAGFDTAFDTPFAGAYVPQRHLGSPQVASLMLEIRRDCYLDEATASAHAGQGRLVQLVRDLTVAVAQQSHLHT